MRRIVFAICTTITGLVLLLSYPTSLNRAVASTDTDTTDADATTTTTTDGATTTSPDTSTSTGSDDTTTDDTTSSDTTTDDTTTSDQATTTEPAATTTTYTGAAAMTRYGNVQVEITVTDGVLTSSQAIDYPNSDRHDQQINSQAIPVLNQEAVAAGSADIAMVSGATYTSDGYIQSLQDALDQAGL